MRDSVVLYERMMLEILKKIVIRNSWRMRCFSEYVTIELLKEDSVDFERIVTDS